MVALLPWHEFAEEVERKTTKLSFEEICGLPFDIIKTMQDAAMREPHTTVIKHMYGSVKIIDEDCFNTMWADLVKSQIKMYEEDQEEFWLCVSDKALDLLKDPSYDLKINKIDGAITPSILSQHE